MSVDYDALWKDMITELFEDFVAHFLPDLYPEIDFSKGYESLEQEFMKLFPESEKSKVRNDKLIKVFLKDGTEQWILIHIEVQLYEETHQIFEGEETMSALTMENTNFAQAFMSKGIKKGKKEGKKEGIEQEKQLVLIRLINRKFGLTKQEEALIRNYSNFEALALLMYPKLPALAIITPKQAVTVHVLVLFPVLF